jgi:hypothetical protein
MAISAVAALTAWGVWDTWMSIWGDVSCCMKELNKRDGELTLRCAGWHVNVVVTSAIVTDIFY